MEAQKHYRSESPPRHRWILYAFLVTAASLAVFSFGLSAYSHYYTEPRDVRSVSCQNTLSLYTAYEFLKFRTDENLSHIPMAQVNQANRAYRLLEALVPLGKCNLTKTQVRSEAQSIIKTATKSPQ